MEKCTKCKSGRIDKGYLHDYAGIQYKSEKFSSWGKLFSGIKNTAYACLDCGYVELYVDPDKLNKKLNKD